MPLHKVENVKHLTYFSLYLFIIFIEMETEMEKEICFISSSFHIARWHILGKEYGLYRV